MSREQFVQALTVSIPRIAAAINMRGTTMPPSVSIHPPEIVVNLDSRGWDTTLRTAINNRNQVKIVMRGQQVASVKNSFPDICKTPAPPAPFVPTPYPNVQAAIRGANLLSLAVLIGLAAGSGYHPPGVNYNRRGAGSQDDELTIYLR